MTTRIELNPVDFAEQERLLVTAGARSAGVFRFPSGVAAVRLRSDRGEIVILPFQGQHVWSVVFDGRDLTMQSMFDQPYPTREFLATFGGFLQHCGATAVGGPGPEDHHPLHGELPNAPYQSAYVEIGQDAHGEYIAVGGSYRHTVAFSYNYTAEPLLKLYTGTTLFSAAMTITNHKRSPMEIFYLAHANFRPVDGGRLVYSAERTPEHVRVRATIPSHIRPGPGYREFLDRLRAEPTLHEALSPELPCDPEVVFFIDYLADEEGWAHSMQMLPDGSADFIRHRPDQLPKATRWISRTPDQDAIAMVEAGTSEPEGYSAEKSKGNARVLRPGETFHCVLEIGALSPEEAAQLQRKIKQIVDGE
jgi:hypothetical protein